MKSNSEGEAALSPTTSRRPFPSFLACAFFLSVMTMPAMARAGASLAEMARLAASEEATCVGTSTLFRGYLSLGLFPEAVSLLERRVRLGLFPAGAAPPLFEEAASAQGRYDDPKRLIAICETAIRSGVRTPRILYLYGTGLREIHGRLAEASAILSQVGTEEPYRLLALYSLGQIAAERGDAATALNLFRRVEEGAGGLAAGGFLASRASRSRAELLLSEGRGPEAAPVFESLLREEKEPGEPLDRIGFAAAGEDPVRALEHLPAEMIAGRPLEDRVGFLLLLGGVARNNGRYETAVDRLTRAWKELEDALNSPSPPSSDPPFRSETVDTLRLQFENLRALRQELASRDPRPDEATRTVVVDLLVGLLFADRSVSLAAADTPPSGNLRILTPLEIAETVRRIEEVSLDGVEVDRLVGQMAATLDTLQNLGHPIQRYRRLARLEKSQKEIHLLRDRIRERRESTVANIEAGRDGDAALLLKDLGLFLNELEEIRYAASETREFTQQYFDILRKKKERVEGEGDPLGLAMRDAIAYADGRVTALLPVVRTLEERERVAAWERNKPGLVALRAAVGRQVADTLVRQARQLRQEPGEPARGESLAALGRAVSLLSGDRLTAEDAADVAVQVGSVLAEGRGRWERFPGADAGERERELISSVLRLLPRDGPSGARREEGLYLRAALRLAVKDPGAGSEAREYLEKYPASPLSAGIGVRLGHEALLAGDTAGASARYRAAADSGNPEASSVARYMLAWIRFQYGDPEGALRELSQPLSDASFTCGDPSPFERSVVSLSVRAGKESPPTQLESYPPVKDGTCGGKIFLSALWEAEEKRGEASRAAEVRDVASRRYPADASGAALEMETVEALLRAGREEEALSRALALREKFGPESAWARSQPAPVLDKATNEMARMLKALGERKFGEGIRTGERASLSSAAAMMGEYFLLREGSPSAGDGELRLKWAIALLGSGDREGGVLLLEELVGEQRGDATGERAAVLYAETMIAGYERKDSTAEDAEDAALLLLGEHPSEKAASLVLRASSAFLAAQEYGRARSMAEEVEGSRFATPAQVTQARLIQSESAAFEGDLAGARGKSDLVLAAPPAGADASSASRAKDLYILSSLKEIDGMAASGDLNGAAAALESLAARFPGAQELPMYLLRAMRLYAQGGDGDGAIRIGTRFLGEFPRKEEALEAAGVVGPLLEEKKEFSRAGDLYEGVAASFPKSEAAPRFLFHAARLAEIHGPPEAAERRFSAYRARYPTPAWMWTYATLSVGLAAGQRGDTKTSTRLMEEGLRKVDAGTGDGSPEELAELAGKSRIAVGETWAEQFRKTRLVLPLDKSLAIKDRFFRRALDAFTKAEGEAPLELSMQASQLSGDLLVEYGKAILASQRPKGLKGSDREEYEEALRTRARSFFERSVDWYAGALDRLEEEEGPSDLAVPLRKRLETAQTLLEGTMSARGEKAE